MTAPPLPPRPDLRQRAREALAEMKRRQAAALQVERLTWQMFAWYIAKPERTLKHTARKFGVSHKAIGPRFCPPAPLAVGPHSEAKARRAARAGTNDPDRRRAMHGGSNGAP